MAQIKEYYKIWMMTGSDSNISSWNRSGRKFFNYTTLTCYLQFDT